MHTQHYGYWCPGAKAPGPHYPQCSLNAWFIGPDLDKNIPFIVNKIWIWNEKRFNYLRVNQPELFSTCLCQWATQYLIIWWKVLLSNLLMICHVYLIWLRWYFFVTQIRDIKSLHIAWYDNLHHMCKFLEQSHHHNLEKNHENQRKLPFLSCLNCRWKSVSE